MITVVDYGMGNIGSIKNMFRKLGVDTTVTDKPKDILDAEKIVLPGVGAFDAAMNRIDELNLRSTLRDKALKDKVPFLGICLGMQLLVNESAEGKVKGLNLIPGKAIRFPKHSKLKVPHMGWNSVEILQETALTAYLDPVPRFYFVHSYFVQAERPSDVMMRCKYGQDFDAGLCYDNIFGVQFHPEKSHKFGMALLKGFAEIPC
jgi:imidazole glycerol-phosphate synthase subunit HisH